MMKLTDFYLFRLEIARKNASLAGVHAMTTIEKLWHENGVEGIKVNGGHVVDGYNDFLLEKVVTFVQKNLQQHVNEMEEH